MEETDKDTLTLEERLGDIPIYTEKVTQDGITYNIYGIAHSWFNSPGLNLLYLQKLLGILKQEGDWFFEQNMNSKFIQDHSHKGIEIDDHIIKTKYNLNEYYSSLATSALYTTLTPLVLPVILAITPLRKWVFDDFAWHSTDEKLLNSIKITLNDRIHDLFVSPNNSIRQRSNYMAEFMRAYKTTSNTKNILTGAYHVDEIKRRLEIPSKRLNKNDHLTLLAQQHAQLATYNPQQFQKMKDNIVRKVEIMASIHTQTMYASLALSLYGIYKLIN